MLVGIIGFPLLQGLGKGCLNTKKIIFPSSQALPSRAAALVARAAALVARAFPCGKGCLHTKNSYFQAHKPFLQGLLPLLQGLSLVTKDLADTNMLFLQELIFW